jgi:L-asparaginase / beta-aspartyl-peptidase
MNNSNLEQEIMKKYTFFLLFILIFTQCDTTKKNMKSETNQKFAIVIHGGAGTILKKNMTPEMELEYKRVLEQAVRTGYTILKNGGSSLDAVEKTINILEDSPLFNAGKGAVFTNQGKNELDASIMDGKTLKAGAIAGVTMVKNPINLARAVMEKSEHVMLSREGAEFFAKQQGIELVDPSYFYVESRYQSLLRAQEKEKTTLDHNDQSEFYDSNIKDSKFGTVGCVALDKNGNIAAGTSTGGMTNKKWGRIGDAPIIGAGTYANNATCGISATGWGEFFMRNVVAYDVSAMMEYKGLPIQKAAKEVIQEKLTKLGGDGGIIGLDKSGTIIMEFNTAGMYRASIDTKGKLTIGIYKENE